LQWAEAGEMEAENGGTRYSAEVCAGRCSSGTVGV